MKDSIVALDHRFDIVFRFEQKVPEVGPAFLLSDDVRYNHAYNMIRSS